MATNSTSRSLVPKNTCFLCSLPLIKMILTRFLLGNSLNHGLRCRVYFSGNSSSLLRLICVLTCLRLKNNHVTNNDLNSGYPSIPPILMKRRGSSRSLSNSLLTQKTSHRQVTTSQNCIFLTEELVVRRACGVFME